MMLSKHISCLAAATLLSIPTTGFSQNSLTYGYSPTVSLHYVSDEDVGDSESKAIYSLLSASVVYELDRASDVKLSFDYIDSDFDASTSNVGQDVSGFSISGVWRNIFVLTRNFKPKLGLGLSIDQIDYENRFIVDSDGFLASSFSNRSETDLALLLSTSFPIGSQRSNPIEADVTYKIPFDKGFQGLTLRLTIFPDFIN